MGTETRMRHGTMLLGLALCMAPLPGLANQHAASSISAIQPGNISESDADLAWRAFLAAGSLDDAMTLARKMLAAHPDSVLWHQRLASAAEQNGKAVVAAHAYAWLATRGQHYELLPKAIELAAGTQQDATLVRLMVFRSTHEPFQAQHWRELIGALLNVGRFDHALALLEAADRAHPRAFFLQQQADIQAELGHPLRQADILRRKIRRYGADASTSLQLATLEYVQGHLQQALGTLKKALGRAPAGARAYWQTLGSLAWTLQDLATSARASAVLAQTGRAEAVDYQRLYLLHATKNPAAAYAYALTGWRQTRSISLFFDALDAARKMHDTVLGREVFASVRTQDLPGLRARTRYWMQWAQLAHQAGHDVQARARYRQALARAPHDAEILSGYLWLLIDTRDTRTLKLLLQRWDTKTVHDPQIRAALAAALALLDRPGRALSLLAPEHGAHRDDGDWLLSYAGVLGQADHAEAAQAVRLQAARAFSHSKPGSTTHPDPPSRRADMLALREHLTPGDPARIAVADWLHNMRSTRTSADPVLDWALAQNHPETSALWLDRHYRRKPAPAWALLSQALASDDATTTMRLLRTRSARLPRRDRVEAAHSLGWDPLAVSLAWQGLSGEPDDRRLARQFQDLATARSNTGGGDLQWRRGGGLASIETTATVRGWLDHDWSLTAHASARRQHRTDATQLGRPAPAARDIDITLTQQLPRGARGIVLGGGQNTASYRHVGLFERYRLSDTWQLDASLDAGARLDDSVPLALGALADQVRIRAGHQWTTRDNLEMGIDAASLRAQGGGHLGARQRLDLAWHHDIWLAPPQVSLFASASTARYQRAGHVPGPLLRLVPAGQAADTRFFVPHDYAQACVGTGLNSGYHDHWTTRGHFFGTLGTCLNSISGLGPIVSAGWSGPILGPDHLSLSLEYSDNTGATRNRNLTVSLGYRYYFTP